MLSDGGSGKEEEGDEADGGRLQSIPLPFGQPPSTFAGKQVSDKEGELDLRILSQKACGTVNYLRVCETDQYVLMVKTAVTTVCLEMRTSLS
jgi:hypothetical protein